MLTFLLFLFFKAFEVFWSFPFNSFLTVPVCAADAATKDNLECGGMLTCQRRVRVSNGGGGGRVQGEVLWVACTEACEACEGWVWNGWSVDETCVILQRDAYQDPARHRGAYKRHVLKLNVECLRIPRASFFIRLLTRHFSTGCTVC